MAMTNREWLRSLTDEELAETLDFCTVCVYRNVRFCNENICSKGITEWLQQEHNTRSEDD